MEVIPSLRDSDDTPPDLQICATCSVGSCGLPFSLGNDFFPPKQVMSSVCAFLRVLSVIANAIDEVVAGANARLSDTYLGNDKVGEGGSGAGAIHR